MAHAQLVILLMLKDVKEIFHLFHPILNQKHPYKVFQLHQTIQMKPMGLTILTVLTKQMNLIIRTQAMEMKQIQQMKQIMIMKQILQMGQFQTTQDKIIMKQIILIKTQILIWIGAK